MPQVPHTMTFPPPRRGLMISFTDIQFVPERGFELRRQMQKRPEQVRERSAARVLIGFIPSL